MSDTLVQCLIFRKSGGRVKAYALLPQIFCKKHPNVVNLLHQNGINHICNSYHVPHIMRGETFEDLVEIFFDDSFTARQGPLSIVSNDDHSALSLLFSKTTVRVRRKNEDATSLQLAINKSNIKALECLFSCKFFITKKASSLLYPATDKSQDTIVEISVKHGTDIYGTVKDGSTRLHLAAVQGSSRIAQGHLEKGADLDAEDEKGNTPVLIAKHPDVLEVITHARNSDGDTALHVAADQGHSLYVQQLIDRGATVDTKHEKNGCTPLHFAVKHKEVVEILLENGFSIHAKNDEGNTPLHDAACYGSLSVVQLLIERGAVVDAKNGGGRTPLHLAAMRNPDITDLLLQNGANPNSFDFSRETPIIRGCRADSVDAIKALLNYGARVDVKWANEFFLAAFLRNGHSIQVFQYLLERCFVDPTLLNVPKDNCDPWYISSCIDILDQHLVKIKILNIKPFNFDEYSWFAYLEEFRVSSHLPDEERISKLKSVCEVEVARMKSQTLGDTGLSLYDILKRNEHGVAHLLRNNDVAEILDTSNWAEQFPAYGNILSYHIEKGKLRTLIQEEGMKMLDFLFCFPKKMPDEIKELILRHLCYRDIATLKRACRCHYK